MKLFRLRNYIVLAVTLLLTGNAFSQATYPFRDASKPMEVRVNDLIGRLTLEEKVSLLGYRSKAVERLGIPAYNWWNEGLHGVARAGDATIFPQTIGLAASFNKSLVHDVADAISTEARSKYNLSTQKNLHLQYMGLTFWTPNINIFRDPRWGRGQETYGEDPYLTAQLGSSFVKGLQGNDPLHLKAAATAKHFVAHSGPEATRDYFNAVVSETDLRNTYMYAFRELVNSGVESVMTAYNRVNGTPNSVNKSLVNDVIRKEWGFKGHVVTDCGALDDVFTTHKSIPTAPEAAAAAIKAGIDLDCSSVLQNDVIKAINQKLLTENEVDMALARLLRTQFKLGFFDDRNSSPYKAYGVDSLHNSAHIALARKAAQQSMVLLKNDKNTLPFKKDQYSAYMVLGPNAAALDAIIGSYHGVSSKVVNFVEGITAAVDPATRVEYDLGCDYRDTTHFGGIWAAGNADATIAVIGLSPVLEGEAGDAFLSQSGGDKKDLSLPASEIAFLKALRKGIPNKPLVAVITAGSDVDVAAVSQYADAVILAWYPGEQGGNALADILFGKVNPSGRLPLTFYNSINDLPDYDSYDMKGRTYRYYDGKVQYPFGYGLSYTSFNLQLSKAPAKSYQAKDGSISAEVQITNAGQVDGDEVVQAYIAYPSGQQLPLRELKQFERVTVAAGQNKTISLNIPIKELMKWDVAKHQFKLYKGSYKLIIGNNAADQRLVHTFEVK